MSANATGATAWATGATGVEAEPAEASTISLNRIQLRAQGSNLLHHLVVRRSVAG